MKKVFIVMALMLTTLQGAWADETQTKWTDEGNYASSYEQVNEIYKTITISDEAQLARLAHEAVNGNHYTEWTVKITKDLDMSSHEWVPIPGFGGFFNGQNHTISGIQVNAAGTDSPINEVPIGFINTLEQNAWVENLVISNSSFNNGTRTGAVVGMSVRGTVRNCHVTNSVKVVGQTVYPNGNSGTFGGTLASTGGVVGLNFRGKIEGCTSAAAETTSFYFVGGICGNNDDGTIKDCLFLGNDVTGGNDAQSWISQKGIILSENTGNGISNCYYSQTNAPFFSWEVRCSTYPMTSVKHTGTLTTDYGLLKAYECGMAFGDNFYATSNHAVKLRCVDGVYYLDEDEDWESLAHHVSEGNSFDGKTLKLTANINISRMVASADHYFCGDFDGQGHRLNADIDNSWEKTNPNPSVAYTAPFSFVKKASIQNVQVSGSIKGGLHTAGLVGKVVEGDQTTIKNCMVEAKITCDHAADGSLADHGGGIIGHGTKAKINVEGCLFKGEITPSTSEKDSYAGAIVGWCEDKTNITVNKCADMGTYGSYFTYKGMNWSHNNGTGITSFAGDYCYSTNGVNASTKVYSITSGTPKITLNVKVNDSDPAYQYDACNMGIYTDGRIGFLCDGIRYAPADETVRFGIVTPADYNYGEVKVNGTAVTPDENKYYSWKMTAANAVVTVDGIVAQKWTDEGHYGDFPAVDEATHTITIKTARELARYAHDFNAESTPHYYTYNDGWTLKLDADLDMSDYYWEPFANDWNKLFLGIFDGQGHTIKGLRMDDETKNHAAFIGSNGGTIKNLKIEKSSFTGNEMVAPIAARNYNTIENCYVGSDVTVEGKGSCIGGVAGWMYNNVAPGGNYSLDFNSRIEGCVTYAKVTGQTKVGGIVGELNRGTVKQCVYAGDQINGDASSVNIIAGTYTDELSDAWVENNYYIGTSMSSDHKKDVKAFPYTTNNEKFQVKLVGDATTFDVSGLAFYQDNNAFAYDGKVYGGKGKTVTFDVTNSNGQVYPISDIKVNGTNVSKGDGGHFSWTTENNAVLDINFDVIELKEFEDNSTVISENTPSLLPVNVQLTGHKFVKDGSWNTLCLPFPVVDLENSPLKGATIKTLSDATYSNGTLTLTFVDDTRIENGRPYLVKWESGEDVVDPLFINVVFVNKSNFEDFPNVMFMGSFNPTNITGEDRSVLYLGENNTLYYPNAAMTIGSCHAYFWLKGITAGDVANGARVVMNFDNGGTTTGISSVATGAASRGNATTDGTWYTLDGRKLDGKPTTKGIFIVNGRKVVIK